MSDRLSRQEIKQDAFTEWVERTSNWVRGHGRQLAWGIAAAVALFLAGMGVASWRGKQATVAGERLEAALEVMQAPIVATNPQPDSAGAPSFGDESARQQRAKELLEAVRREYRGSEAAAQAAVHLGEIALSEDRPEEARSLWNSYLDRHRDGLLAGAVQLSLMRLDREEGKGEAVVERLRKELQRSDSVLPEDVLLFELGTTLEALDRGDEAREPYTKIGDNHPDSPYAAVAQDRLAQLPTAPEPAIDAEILNPS